MSHSWMTGSFVTGDITGTVDVYTYLNPWEAYVRTDYKRFEKWELVYESSEPAFHYKWHSPFEFRDSTGPNRYTASIYSNIVKEPAYKVMNFPWGHYRPVE